MNYTKILANALTAFGTALVAGNLVGLTDLAFYLAVGNAMFTGILAAIIEFRKQSEKPIGLAKNMLVV